MKKCYPVLFLFLATQIIVAISSKANPVGQLYIGEIASPEGIKPPQIEVSYPKDDAVLEDNNITLRFNISTFLPEEDYGGIYQIWYKANWLSDSVTIYEDLVPTYSQDDVNVYIHFPAYPYHKSTFSAVCDLQNIPEGKNSITIYATARGFRWIGGESYGDYKIHTTATINFFIDHDRPIVYAPLNNTNYTSSSIPLMFMLNEATDSLSFSLDEDTKKPLSGNTTLSNLASGEHTIIVYVSDKQGNIGILETITFNVTSQEAPLTLMAIIAGATFACLIVVATSVLVYRHKYVKIPKNKPKIEQANKKTN